MKFRVRVSCRETIINSAEIEVEAFSADAAAARAIMMARRSNEVEWELSDGGMGNDLSTLHVDAVEPMHDDGRLWSPKGERG